MRCVWVRSAQLPRRLNMLNKDAGNRQATSCKPQAAAWRVAATTLTRSWSYHSRASWAPTKRNGSGASSCCGGGAHVPVGQSADRGVPVSRGQVRRGPLGGIHPEQVVKFVPVGADRFEQ